MATFNASSTGGTLNGSAQNDTINGSAVSDQLYGLAGNDTIYGNAGNDQLYGGDGNDNLYGGSGDDLLSGGSGNDLLDGGDGNDVLLGDIGNDQNYGGAGSDTIDYSLSPNAVTVSLLGVGSGGFAAGDTWSGIETVIGSAYNDSLTGDIYDNTLIGGAGADFLSGGLGGIDTASYVYSNAGVTINLGTNVATGGDAQGDTFSSIENLVGSALNDTLTGDASANTITAGDGNDVVDGGNGNDVIYGGNGDDTLTGNYGTDKMYGGAGNDTMLAEWDDGSGDYYDGGDGIDTYKIDGTAVQSYALQIDLVTGTSQYHDTFISIENLIGGQGNDVFYGDAGVNELSGRDGNDTIDGRGGNDYVAGENGDDTLTGGDGDDVVDGGAGKDSLSGGAGNDKLIGGAGADALSGGDGTDVANYSASSAGVTVSLATGAGLGGDAAGDTLTGIENVTGSAFADVLTGTTGVNVLDGGAGDDVLAGGLGADTVLGGAGVDTADYSAAAAGVTVNLATGTASDGDTLVSIENATGSAFNDVLVSAAGANVLNGGAGVDTADYSSATAGVTVNLAAGTASDGDTLVSIENVVGSAFNDVLVSAAGANVLNGGAGVDTVDYSLAAVGVTVNLAAGTASDGDTLVSIENAVGSAFNDVLVSAAGANVLNGGAGVDTADYSFSSTGLTINLSAGTASDGDTLVSIENVTGSAFNDVLVSAAGVNVLNGGAGVDTADYSSATAGVTVNLAAGTASDGDTLRSIENVVGSAFNDVLVSAAGANVLNGGAGVDTADYSFAAAGLTINLAARTASDGDTLLSIENATGSAFNDVLLGDTGANVLNGGAGDDVLVGGLGADTLRGGDGIDTADYTSSTAAVIVNLDFGNGLGGAAEGDQLSGIENVLGTQWADVLTGNAGANKLEGLGGDDTLHGLAGDDQIFGGAGNDRIYGGAGADLVDGGAGTDTADYRYSAEGVTVSLMTNTGTSGDAQGDVLVSIENLAGSEFDDTLTGNDGMNRLVGGMGSDHMYGMGGNDMFDTGGGYDTVDGGAGVDTVTYDDSWGAVVVNLATGMGSGAEAANDTYLNVENVIGSLFNDKLVGDAGVNLLTGLDGNDILDGGAGNDVLVGGQGADTLIGGTGDQDVASYQDASAGVVVNLVSGGTAGEAAGDTYNGVEYVYGSAFNDTIIGNDAVNRLVGGDGNDYLDGAAGNDVLVGGQGADTLIGGAGDQDAASYQDAQLAVIVNLALGGTGGEAAGDTYSGIEYVYGSAFNDQIIGDGAINRLTGGAGNDTLDGAAGNDYLLGDAGNDVLVGGAGADVFVFNAGFGDDTISDFWAGAGRTDRAWFQGVTGINSYADVLAHAADSAAGVVISVAGQGSLTLSGLTIAQLNADDFLFG